jgi:Tfp pilus assembly protein PilV
MSTHTSRSERGVALIVVLLLMMLVGAILAGFSAVLMNEQRMEKTEQDRTDAFYAAHGALEKMTTDIGSLFAVTYSPSTAQIAALTVAAQRPAFTNVSYPTTSEGSGYAITPKVVDADGNPASVARSITTGDYTGFSGLVTRYTLAVTAQTISGGEARLQRELQTVGIPIFQFGVFSESDLAFEPGPPFTFSGRVHTNANLYLGAAQASLTLADKVTAVGDIVRAYLSTGDSNSYGDDTWVRISTKAGSYRALKRTEGSVVGDVGSAVNSKWKSLSTGTYNSRILGGNTGVAKLNLPLVEDGAEPIELIRRPPTTETTTSTLYGQRFFAKASMRILLSDTSADITSLPGVTSTAPIALNGNQPAGYTYAAATPPFALAASPTTYTSVKVLEGTPLLGGYLKVEIQTSAGVWQDVTLEILKLGIAGYNQQRTSCTVSSPNAVLRLQRIYDNSANCYSTSVDAKQFVPQTLFDARQGKLVDVQSTGQSNVQLGGVTHYIELDVTNLSRYFVGTIGSTGTSALNNDGYTVYFSDRRGNRNAAGVETGEYGFEDFVMTSSTQTSPNGTLNTGEDLNGNGTLETYGATYAGTYPLMTDGTAPTWSSLMGSTVRPYTDPSSITVDMAKRNPARFFRRALKLTNGTPGNIVSPGLTIAAENPVYVQGNYNASATGWSTPATATHVACAIIGDAITLLSTAWRDYKSFETPYESNNRLAATTYYRFASMAGKGIAFNEPFTNSRAGSDGGVNNYARFLENWFEVTFHYRGSMIGLWYNRQAVAPFRNATSSGGNPVNNNAYYPPERDIQFDTDFLTMSKLPPATPMFRDINVLGFTQVTTVPTN